MRAGRLKELITIQNATTTRGTSGQVVESWGTFCTARAEKIDLSGREFFSADRVNAEITTRFSIRQRTDITPKMRVVHNSITYEIVAPPIHIDRDETQLMTRALDER